MKTDKRLIGVGLLTAISASLCCITPVLALITGTSGVASTFSWIAPFRPYLIGMTILVLGFGWYQKLKAPEISDCECETDETPHFFQSKSFLGIITATAIMMLAFPYFSNNFYGNTEKAISEINKSDLQSTLFRVSGMTCISCEEHIYHSVNKLNGIVNTQVLYENKMVIIEFDKTKTKTNVNEIEKAINATGYKVIDNKENE